jgi:hypothetical protein
MQTPAARARMALLGTAVCAGLVAALGLGWAAAVALRQAQLPVASALGDAMGPWWVGARGAWSTAPHAPPYGFALALPHQLCLWGAGSLWEAFARLQLVHALVAPAAGLLAARAGAGPVGAAAVALLAAAHPGLLDTAASGAEGYLAALWVGLGAAAARGPRPLLAAPAFAAAVMNHPLALGALPLLAGAPARAWGLTALLLLPSAAQLGQAAPGALDPSPAAPLAALMAHARQGGPAVLAEAVGLLLLLRRRPREGLALLLSLGLVLLLGAASGALRDHHLRLLSLPALAGLAALPRGLGWLPILALRLPPDPVPHEGAARRPGTLGLLTRVAAAVHAGAPRPAFVQGVVARGPPAVEAGALLLDLRQRGWTAADLSPDGAWVLLWTGPRGAPPPGLRTLDARDGWAALTGDLAEARAWAAPLCGLATPGGAMDGLPALISDARAEHTLAFWPCPETADPPRHPGAHPEPP